jgi:hypothetical protein
MADFPPLSELLASVDSPEGRARVAAYLETLPFPHFRAVENGLLERIEADGSRTVGQFVRRKWRVWTRRVISVEVRP